MIFKQLNSCQFQGERYLFNLIHNKSFRKLFKEVVNSPLYANFFHTSVYGKKCILSYENFKEELNIENDKKECVGLDNFFNKYIHLALLPKYKTAITVRYLHIFINELNYRFIECKDQQTQEKLATAFLLIVLLNELVNYIFIKDEIELDEEGRLLFQSFILGRNNINSIDIIQADTIINIDSWKSNENPIKDTYDVLLLNNKVKVTNEEKKLKELHHNIPLIHFMCAKPDNKNWCGATFP